jgi:hypothetical protein
MTRTVRIGRTFLASLFVFSSFSFVSMAAPRTAQAQDTEAQKEANVHFQRAVGLYAEADYRAALVEFKRAYEIAPHVTVLYNLGQTYYQLQNYAEALSTFERFLAEGGTAHRAEVENAVNVLKSRVGKLDITTASPGWEILIDDEAVGKTPLAKPIGVSVGRRKITVTKAGESNQSRYVEVAAGETAGVAFGAAAAKGESGNTLASDQPGPATDKGGNTLLVVGWVATGALAAGAVVTGILAASAASDLDDARGKFPGNAADIDDKASTTTTLSVTTDVLAGAAILLGGVSLYFTLTDKGGKKASVPSVPSSGVRLGGTPGRFVFGGTF